MDNQKYSNSTFDEIIFENRNKSYGAFLLRKLYNKNVFTALGLSALVFSALLYIPLAGQLRKKVAVVEEAPKKPDTLAIIDVPLDPRTPPPPPLPEIEVPKIKTVKFVPLEVAPEDKDVREPDPKSQEDLNKTTASTTDQDGVNDTTGTTMTNAQKGVLGGMEGGSEEEQIFTGLITKYAQPPGGNEGLKKYINNNISDPLREFITDRGIKGRMFVTITVASDGKVIEAKLSKGLTDCPRCDSEIPNIISKMPNWTPGESNGHKVRLKFNLPITF